MVTLRIILFVINLWTVSVEIGKADDCVPRDFGYGSIVCVCNSTYCDSVPRSVPDKGQYRSYESNKAGKRLSQVIGNFISNATDSNEVDAITININADKKYQTILGFGGAFTDSAGINIEKLSQQSQNNILEAYFGQNGSRYNLARVPAAGTDFSTRPYTYADKMDETLESFALAPEDFRYKIPLMHKALLLNPQLRFVSASWTAPPWMKTNDQYNGFGFLKKKYYQTYADYLVKFLLEYKKQGLKISAISTGNEPMDVLFPFFHINSMGWTPDTVADWIANNLGPTIAASESNDTMILIIDDQRINLSWYVDGIFKNDLAKNYTSGIAVHFYWDQFTTPLVDDFTHDEYPDKFILMTEACVGTGSSQAVHLGDWERGEKYISNIIENLSHWVTGWMEWNLALDKAGGPNWIMNNVDASVIVEPETDEFYKQPTYYALAHFSKFISEGSTRIGTTTSGEISHLSFLTPDDEIVVVLYNSDNDTRPVTIKDPELGCISRNLSPKSIQTIIYKK
ncbi:lysosomal acid glucosylceramidase-like [Venturia canescens]|uniref:lysosomal acid glucosylceramidase-like n=1 Tax=Venturia canescens TaxID=32260 RepID=UPI001C9C0134|nr:lysosomal acid glucosylceramidase-like [Venturia canescens]XP_043277696.1 lysosomal acid glucosylceramidase-like [Venturia canescens]